MLDLVLPAVCLGQTAVGTRPGMRRLIFPGSFHPLHAGHLEMARLANGWCGHVVEYELSVLNVDKPPLDDGQIAERAAQFRPDQPLWITRAATFLEKARLFPRATFIVGADTIRRIADPTYYLGGLAAQAAAFDEFRLRDTQFLVFGRQVDGMFRTLNGLELPDALRKLCRAVDQSQFRHDISSTELRERPAG